MQRVMIFPMRFGSFMGRSPPGKLPRADSGTVPSIRCSQATAAFCRDCGPVGSYWAARIVTKEPPRASANPARFGEWRGVLE